MRVSEIVDAAFRLFRANIRAIVIIVVTLSGPLQLIVALVDRSTLHGSGLSMFTQSNLGQQQSIETSRDTAQLIASGLTILVLPYVAGAVSRLVAASYLGDDIPVGLALRAVVRRAPALFLAWVMVHLLEAVGTVLIVLPGLVVMALSVCVAPAIVLEGLGPFRGLGRSWSLGRRRLWGVMGAAIASGILVTVVSGVVEGPFLYGAFAIGLHWGWILIFVGGLLGQVFSLSLTAIVATLIYFDLRIRTEGLDLQLLARDNQ
jgi:hypothetical protein